MLVLCSPQCTCLRKNFATIDVGLGLFFRATAEVDSRTHHSNTDDCRNVNRRLTAGFSLSLAAVHKLEEHVSGITAHRRASGHARRARSMVRFHV